MGTAIGSSPRRTTVTLSPESLEIVERFKNASGASTSGAIDQLIRRTEPAPSRLKELNGFLVLDTPANRRGKKLKITLDDIKRMEDDMDREYVERLMPPKRPSGPRVLKRSNLR